MSKNNLWWKNSVFYSTYVDKFAADFAGFTQKLDYLSRLGVDCIHLLPLYPSPMVDDGYDISDYCNIRPELGMLDDFSRFVEAAHKRGIRILIDLVLNHTSTEHPWFREARSSKNNSKRSFYLWSETGKEYAEAANPFAVLKPKNWIYNPPTGDYYFSTFYAEQADLDWNNPEVFSEMMRIVDFWTDRGVDGFRFDAASHLIKKEGSLCVGIPQTHAALKKIRRYFNARHPGVAILGEASGSDSVQTAKEYFGNGDECHLVYHFRMVGQLFLAIKRNDPGVLKKIIGESRGIPDNAEWATFLQNHDQVAFSGLPEKERNELLDHFDPGKKYRFNSGIAIRLANLFRGDEEKVLGAFKLLFDAPGSPIIYYGDEIGMENIKLPPGEKDARRAVRGKFDWEKAAAAQADPNSLFNGIANMIKKWKKQNNK